MSTTFSCVVDTTDPSAALGLEIWLDDQAIYSNTHVKEKQTFEYEFSDDDGAHELRFVMRNKTDAHTCVDDQGKIVSDACITIGQVAFDELELEHTFVKETQYSHDFNGTQEPVVEPFYGVMGCNGTVSLRFTTPVYLWLLEHM